MIEIIGKTCLICNKHFHIFPSENNKKFCSRKCYTKYRNKNTKQIRCLNCNQLIIQYKCKPNKKYCSQPCYWEYIKKITCQHPIIKYCKICNTKLIFYYKHLIRETCSKKCKHKLNGQKRKGITWKMSKEGRKKISIGRKKYLSNPKNLKLHAKNTKNSWTNEITRQKRLTSERALKISKTGKRQYALGIKKVPHIKNSKYSKTTKYKKILFRSTWEAKVAKWFDKNNIKWEYETKNCIVKLPNGSIYIIDFFLPEIKKHVEVKGFYDEKSIYKLDQAMLQGYNIYVIDKTNINNINLNIDWRTHSKFFMELTETWMQGET